MKYFDSFTGGEDSFWEEFPYFKDVTWFNKLYKEDRSKDKNKSSKTMWYMVLVYDIDSEFYSLASTEQYKIVCDTLSLDVREYLKGQEEIDILANRFINFIDTVITADIRATEEKLVERKEFIKYTTYSLDEMVYPGEGESFRPYMKKGTAAQLDKMVVDTKDIHEEIRKLREAAKQDQADQGKGGRVASFIE